MIKYTRFYITFLLIVIAFAAKSQSTATTSSPYSQYGIGDLDPSLLPQQRAMGGVATAINRINGYNNINIQNPASYGYINLTTIDAGINANFNTLNQTGQLQNKNANFRYSHLAFAFPVTQHSALSFGLVPYSALGYNYVRTSTGYGSKSPADTNTNNHIYSGEGGLSKAFFGYGFTVFKHLSIGANVSYIFGNLKTSQANETPLLYGNLNTESIRTNSIGGLNYDYGVQYAIDLSDTKHLTLGYSASANSKIGDQATFVVSQYTRDASGNKNIAADSVVNTTYPKSTVALPQINHFGIAFQKDGSFLVAADYTMGNWSALSVNGINAGLQNNKLFNIGGQITPNILAPRNYLALIDYRLGFLYEQTNLNSSVIYGTGSGTNTSINRYAITLGLGLPLRSELSTFYKINVSAEIGQRGTVANGLVRENYVNLHLGFTLNDKWFKKYKND
jgi:hypothetical protein